MKEVIYPNIFINGHATSMIPSNQLIPHNARNYYSYFTEEEIIMARKNRYQNSIQSPAIPTSLAKAGIYTRISVPDGDDVSESIANQIQLAMNHIEHSEGLEYVKTYTDDGYTGLNFDRPGFRQMMQDVKAGLINCIIVKDISRLGRNYLAVGKLLLEDFPEMGIRFISILNYYDNVVKNDDIELRLILQTIVDQKVSMDTSKRVTSAIDAKKKAGTFLPPAGSIPYGYLRDEKNCTYAIDDEAFLVVKRIYHLRSQGYNISAICKELDKKGIPSPSKLKYLRHQTKDENAKYALWNRATVRKILSDENYIGNRVHGKKAKDSPTAAKRRTSKDEWQIIENAHPAIISKELFDQVQAMNEKEDRKYECTDTSVPKESKPNILKGKVFCGDCGKAMKAAKGGDGTANYNCSSYKESGGSRCSNHYISQEAILTAITQEIERILSDGFLCGRGEAMIAEYENHIAEIDADVHQLSAMQDDLTTSLMDAYEAYLSHRITKDEFKQENEHYDAEHTDCEGKERTLISEKAVCQEQLNNLTRLITVLRTYQKSRVLTRELVEAFIEKVLIFPKQRIEFQLFFPEL